MKSEEMRKSDEDVIIKCIKSKTELIDEMVNITKKPMETFGVYKYVAGFSTLFITLVLVLVISSIFDLGYSTTSYNLYCLTILACVLIILTVHIYLARRKENIIERGKIDKLLEKYDEELIEILKKRIDRLGKKPPGDNDSEPFQSKNQ